MRDLLVEFENKKWITIIERPIQGSIEDLDLEICPNGGFKFKIEDYDAILQFKSSEKGAEQVNELHQYDLLTKPLTSDSQHTSLGRTEIEKLASQFLIFLESATDRNDFKSSNFELVYSYLDEFLKTYKRTLAYDTKEILEQLKQYSDFRFYSLISPSDSRPDHPDSSEDEDEWDENTQNENLKNRFNKTK